MSALHIYSALCCASLEERCELFTASLSSLEWWLHFINHVVCLLSYGLIKIVWWVSDGFLVVSGSSSLHLPARPCSRLSSKGNPTSWRQLTSITHVLTLCQPLLQFQRISEFIPLINFVPLVELFPCVCPYSTEPCFPMNSSLQNRTFVLLSAGPLNGHHGLHGPPVQWAVWRDPSCVIGVV